MIRRALVIGDGSSGGRTLRGVPVDHRQYRAFLESDAGGAWRANEISSVKEPLTETRLLQHIRAAGRSDYALVVFTGHGFTHEDRSFVCVGPELDVEDEVLETGAPRQLTIIDACRTPLATEEGVIKTERTVLAGLLDERFAVQYRHSCRELFDDAVRSADQGTSVIHACSIGQAAGDTARGGLFSRTLIERAAAWAKQKRTARHLAEWYLPVDELFDVVVDSFLRSRRSQRPVEYLGRRRVHFPFAVA